MALNVRRAADRQQQIQELYYTLTTLNLIQKAERRFLRIFKRCVRNAILGRVTYIKTKSVVIQVVI